MLVNVVLRGIVLKESGLTVLPHTKACHCNLFPYRAKSKHRKFGLTKTMANISITKQEIDFESSTDSLDAAEFSLFLLQFSLIHDISYNLLMKSYVPLAINIQMNPGSFNIDTKENSEIIEEIRREFRFPYMEFDYHLFHRNRFLENKVLRISSINKNSPLCMVVEICVPALVFAVILSGGKIESSPDGFKATLPPISDGLEKLRKFIRGFKR